MSGSEPRPGMDHGVSVVIPSHQGRLLWVRRLLDSLVEATHGLPEPSEVIVVDDSEEPESTLLREACALRHARYVRGPANAGAKRNVGYREARFDILLFIDSDCVAHPDLVREHLCSLRGHEDSVGAVLGLTTMVGQEPFHWQVAAHSRFYNQCYEFALDYGQVLWGTTSNLACRRSALDHIGGFDDDTLTRVGGEDVDLGVRMNKAGYVVATNPSAHVDHSRDHIGGLRPIMRSLFTYGRADVYLLLRHPERGSLHLLPGLLPAFVCVVIASQMPLFPTQVRVGGVLVAGLTVVGLVWRIAGSLVSGQPHNLYRPSELGRLTASPASILYRAIAYMMDRLFAVGSWCEAIRQGQPWLALRRFKYTGTAEFVPRRPITGTGIEEVAPVADKLDGDSLGS